MGPVTVRVQLHGQPPPVIDNNWEIIVERDITADEAGLEVSRVIGRFLAAVIARRKPLADHVEAEALDAPEQRRVNRDRYQRTGP